MLCAHQVLHPYLALAASVGDNAPAEVALVISHLQFFSTTQFSSVVSGLRTSLDRGALLKRGVSHRKRETSDVTTSRRKKRNYVSTRSIGDLQSLYACSRSFRDMGGGQ